MNVGMSLGKMQKINEACNILSRVETKISKKSDCRRSPIRNAIIWLQLIVGLN